MPRQAAVQTGGTGADRSVRIRNLAIPDILTSVGDPVELFEDMVEIDAKIWIGNDRQRQGNVC